MSTSESQKLRLTSESPPPGPRTLSWAPLAYLVFPLFLWLCAMALSQNGWASISALSITYIQVVVLAICAVSLLDALRKGPDVFAATLATLFVLVWIAFAGPLVSWRFAVIDLLCLVGGTFLVVGGSLLIERLRKGRSPATSSPERATSVGPPKPESPFVFAAVILTSWILISLASFVLNRPLPLDPDRLATVGPEGSMVPDAAERWQDLRIGLALSGGGYRAAAFHAGSLQALEQLGIRVDNLSTVSGGSIIGSFYAAGGDPATFVDALQDHRLDLKRRLFLFHNAVRLPFPFKVPKLKVELFPWYRFDRLDAQEALLDDVLLAGAERQADPFQPELMVAATDLTYGFQLGLFEGGMLKLSESLIGDTYRGGHFQPQPEASWSLARKVAVSGAFPLAFPARPYPVRVSSSNATGDGIRPLLLVDGGIRDNLGLDLLRAADRSAENGQIGQEPGTPPEALEEFMAPAWDLDALLISDGGATFNVWEEAAGGLATLPRTFSIAEINVEGHSPPEDRCRHSVDPVLAPKFSPASQMIPPDTQFNLKRDSSLRAALDREWGLRLDPAQMPEPVLREIVRLLANPEIRSEAERDLDHFLAAWHTHGTRDQQWSRSLRKALRPVDDDFARALASPCASTAADNGSPPGLLPGSCEAAALRHKVQISLLADLETFRTASTLDDRLSGETLDTLERLGQLLVYLEWPRIEQQLDQALACQAASE